jgi:hypothetical protein
MKTIVAAVACAIAGFGGLQAYFYFNRDKAPAPQPETVAEAVAEEPKAEQPKPPEEPAPRPKKASSTASSKSKSAAPKYAASYTPPPQTKPKPKAVKKEPPAGDLYFTVEKNSNGLASRVFIHNAPGGKYSILLIGAGNSGTQGFGGKGTTSDKKHTYEIYTTASSTTVTWDGKPLRQGG